MMGVDSWVRFSFWYYQPSHLTWHREFGPSLQMVRTIPVYEALPRVLCAQAQALGVSGTKAIGENILLFRCNSNNHYKWCELQI